MLPDQLNIAVFASGRGSNLRAILDAIKAGKIRNTQIVAVISNNSDAGALGIARENKIPAVHLSRKYFEPDETFNDAVLQKLQEHKVNFIVLAGYMKKIDRSLIRAYKNRMLNIHPALLPEFGGKGMYGMHVHEAVIACGAKISGATIHVVDEEYDHGPIVIQRTVRIAPNETPETLAAKVSTVEHEIYPEAIRYFAKGRVKFNGQKITIENE